MDRNKRRYDVVTTNASSQAGHTAIHKGNKYVTRHLPTAPLIVPGSVAYLNAGCAIDPEVLEQELKDYDYLSCCTGFYIHPRAAVITPDCIEAEGRDDSPQTKIASTRKGVGEAIARKVLRAAPTAIDHPFLKQFVHPLVLNRVLMDGGTVLVEIPQGYSLSLNGNFYPHCTSRDCTVMQGISDAHIHPDFLGAVMLVLRTNPIRVGNLNGHSSGGCYPDQAETSWEELGQPSEITTVTKRVRRVFTWSRLQLFDAVMASRPDLIFLTHCDGISEGIMNTIVSDIKWEVAQVSSEITTHLVRTYGPSTNEAIPYGAVND